MQPSVSISTTNPTTTIEMTTPKTTTHHTALYVRPFVVDTMMGLVDEVDLPFSIFPLVILLLELGQQYERLPTPT